MRVFTQDYLPDPNAIVAVNSTSRPLTPDPFEDDFDLSSSFPPVGCGNTSQNELEIYLDSPPKSRNLDVLGWWKLKQELMPYLTQMARDYLAIPASSVPSEQAFSEAGDILSKRRNRIEGETMGAIMCLKSWLRSDELQEAIEEMELSNVLNQLKVEDSNEKK